MKKRKLKIKWINVIKLLVFIFCVYMILHDLYMVSIYSWVTGNLVGWTWFGFITFILFVCIAGMIYDDFEDEIEKASTTRNSQR